MNRFKRLLFATNPHRLPRVRPGDIALYHKDGAWKQEAGDSTSAWGEQDLVMNLEASLVPAGDASFGGIDLDVPERHRSLYFNVSTSPSLPFPTFTFTGTQTGAQAEAVVLADLNFSIVGTAAAGLGYGTLSSVIPAWFGTATNKLNAFIQKLLPAGLFAEGADPKGLLDKTGTVTTTDGTVVTQYHRNWVWTAPSNGRYLIRFRVPQLVNNAGVNTLKLDLLVQDTGNVAAYSLLDLGAIAAQQTTPGVYEVQLDMNAGQTVKLITRQVDVDIAWTAGSGSWSFSGTISVSPETYTNINLPADFQALEWSTAGVSAGSYGRGYFLQIYRVR